MRSSKENHSELYDVAIVGAGFSGLYLLHRCRQLGLSARIWEKGAGLGGVWYWNRYPGARCDVESMQYCYQFDEELQQQWTWSERYSPQPEILTYLEHVAQKHNLADGIDFKRQVQSACYDDVTGTWTLYAESGETLNSRFCVMATGCLSQPNWPTVEGLDQFQGDVHHTALWPHDGVDFHGKNVAVIGTGSSGIQSIPHIAAVANQLTIFQRTPNYSVPARNKPLDPDVVKSVKAEYAQLRKSASEKNNAIDGHYSKLSALSVSATEREAEYERRWQHGGLTFLGAYGDLLTSKDSNDTMVNFVHDKIASTVNDRTTAKLLMPENVIGGKRMCVDINYYATYNRDNVELVDLNSQPIVRLDKTAIVTNSTEYKVDIVVIATGFDAMTGALNQIDIKGRSGVALKDRWQSGPSTYLGLAMSDYPNLFTVTGPGSPSVLTNMLPSIEQHVEWITDCIAYMDKQNYSVIEATAEAEAQWWEHVQEVGKTGLKHTANSWYVGANIAGKSSDFLPYSGGFPNYCQKCREVVDSGYSGFTFK